MIKTLILFAGAAICSPFNSNVQAAPLAGREILSSDWKSDQLKSLSPVRDTAVKGSGIYFKTGPEKELKWDFGPVSLGWVMDLSLVPLSKKGSSDLMISRIWQGLYLYPSDNFSKKSLLNKPYFLGKGGVLLFQPLDWNNDGVADLIAADRDGFLYEIPGEGAYPEIKYENSEATIIRDLKTKLPFQIPYDNPNHKKGDLNGYLDAQYYNYVYPEIYITSRSSFRDLIIGDQAGNLWWLPEQSHGKGKPSYSGIKYRKEKSNHAVGIKYQKSLGFDYVKPGEKITDEREKPFLLGIGRDEEAVFEGANTRPVLYPDESGIPGLLVLSGTNDQQIYFLKRINSLDERKPVFKNMGEVHISGLDKGKLNFHSKVCIFNKKGKNNLLLASENYLAEIELTGWKDGVPQLEFDGWMEGPDVTGAFYAFQGMSTDENGKKYVIHFTGTHWNLLPVIKKSDGIRLQQVDSLEIRDQNGIFTVEGETDPQGSPKWGYHRIAQWNFDGKSNKHLIAATDKGHLYLLEDDPALTQPGRFIFRSSGPLKDSSGKVIRIHNRAVAGGIDLNDDGREDLLVGGASYQLGIKSDPNPGAGVYYLINLGNDKDGRPILSPPRPLDLGPDFNPPMNRHVGLQILDLNNDKEQEIIISLQQPDWDGRIFHKVKGEIRLKYSGLRLPVIPINEQVLDIDDDGHYDLVRAGGERGVGNYKKLEKQ